MFPFLGRVGYCSVCNYNELSCTERILSWQMCLIFKSLILVELWKVSEADLIIWPTQLLNKVNIINELLISYILKKNYFGRGDCSWVALDSLFSNAYLPGSAGKSCLWGGLHSTSLFRIPRVIHTLLYLGFHHALLCYKYQFYWQLSAFLTLLCWLKMCNCPTPFFCLNISQRYNEQQQGLEKNTW